MCTSQSLEAAAGGNSTAVAARKTAFLASSGSRVLSEWRCAAHRVVHGRLLLLDVAGAAARADRGVVVPVQHALYAPLVSDAVRHGAALGVHLARPTSLQSLARPRFRSRLSIQCVVQLQVQAQARVLRSLRTRAQYGGSQYGGAQYGGAQHGGAQYGGAQYGAQSRSQSRAQSRRSPPLLSSPRAQTRTRILLASRRAPPAVRPPTDDAARVHLARAAGDSARVRLAA